MTSQPVTSSHPAPRVPGAARHRHIRAAAAIAGVAALIAAGGYLATTTIGPDATPPAPATTATEGFPSAETLRELRQSIAGQYGSRSAVSAAVNPSAGTLRELRQSIAGQYGSLSAAGAVANANARVRRELRASIAGQYGPAR